MSAHAKLSPSGAETWFNCAGSVAAQEGLPDETSEFAAEGTFAHHISELCLELGLDPYDFIGHRAVIEGYSFEWSEDDADDLAFGIEQIREFRGKFYGEHQVDLSNWLGPDQFGTLDRGIVGADLIVIGDLKWGRGIPVSPVENKQLMLYALGFWWNIARHVSKATKFLIIIDQPRCNGGGGEWYTTLDELLAFGEEAKKRAEATRDAAAERTASEKGCKWCKRRSAPGGCPTFDTFMVDLFGAQFDDLDDNILIGAPLELPVVITPERRSYILDNRKLIQDWLDGLHARALDDALHGRPCGGKKAVEGRKSPDKWKNIEKADAALVAFLGEGRFNNKLKTPTQVAKELKFKDDVPAELEELIERGQRKPALVSEQDARPAMLVNLEQMFDDLDD
jgi:hypothetical protein